MFQRRMFGSSGIPRCMFRSLHIQSAAQATRMLPSLVVLPTSMRSVSSGIAALAIDATLRQCPTLSSDALVDEMIAMMLSDAALGTMVWCKRNMGLLQTISGLLLKLGLQPLPHSHTTSGFAS